MNKETLKCVLQQATQRPLPEVRARSLELPLAPTKVVTLTGIRRSGKTFLLFQTIRRLMEAGIGRESVIYLNLADDRLSPIALSEMDLILAAHGELYPETIGGPLYLFLDEVQEVEGWEKYVRRIYDTENVKIFVTGSSARVLTRDLAPVLRGRGIGYELFPLSFAEYASFLDLPTTEFDREAESRLAQALQAYVQWGGLPEIVLAEDALRPLILADYTSLIFYRHILERYPVRNEPVMKLLFEFCASRPSSLLSVHKLHRDMCARGVTMSKDTLDEYLDYMEDAFILYRSPRHGRSVRKQEQNPKKIYLVDPAFGRAFAAPGDPDRSAWLENLVFLHVRRCTREICYASNPAEIDLIYPVGDRLRFVNVTWSLTEPETSDREEKAMASGRKLHPDAEGTLVAHETAGVPTAVPAYRFLLSDPL